MPIFISQDVDEVINEPLIGWQDFFHVAPGFVQDVDNPPANPRRNALNGLTYNFWQVGPALQTLSFHRPAGRAIDYAGIAAHTLGSTGRGVRVVWSDNGVDWENAHTGGWYMASTDAPLMFYFPRQNHTYWGIQVQGGDTAYIGVVYMGLALRMKRRIYGGHSPASLSRQTDILPQRSVNGAFLGRSVIRRGITTTYAFNNLPADWYRENFDPFVQSALERPFFVAWRPDDHPEDCVYAWTTGDIAPTNTGTRDFMSVSFSVEGIAE